jgi:hypothetical protein
MEKIASSLFVGNAHKKTEHYKHHATKYKKKSPKIPKFCQI